MPQSGLSVNTAGRSVVASQRFDFNLELEINSLSRINSFIFIFSYAAKGIKKYNNG
jgi:hypothetical protein